MSLVYYAASGDLAMLNDVLSLPVNVNQKNEEGETALVAAVKAGHFAIVNRLLWKKADPNFQNDDGDTALIAAADNGDKRMVELLLAKGANPNIQNKDGETSLIMATDKNHVKIVELLLKHHADPNIQNNQEDTALIVSCLIGDEKIAKLLMDHGADPAIQNDEGNTALIISSSLGYTNIIKLLLQYPSTVFTIYMTNKNGDDAFEVVKSSERKKILPLLAKARSSLDISDSLTRDQFEKIKELLERVAVHRTEHTDGDLREIIHYLMNEPSNEAKVRELFSVVDPTDYHTLNRLQSIYTQMLKAGEISTITNIFHYARNPKKPQELSITYDRKGEKFVRSDFKVLLWILYLIKKYNLSACYLINVSTESPLPEPKNESNRKVQIIRKKFDYCSLDFCSHYSIAMFYDQSRDKFTFYIDPEIGPKINRCQQRFVVIPLYLAFVDQGHDSLIMIDKVTHEVEMFDPNGYSSFAIFNKYLFDIIKVYLDNSSEYQFYETLDYCPPSSVQTIVEPNLPDEFVEKYGYAGGFCQTWVPIYLHYRLMNQNVPRDEVVRYLVENPETISQLLVDYIQTINEVVPDESDKVISFVEEYNPTFSINLRRYADDIVDVSEEDTSPQRKKQRRPSRF